MAGKDAHFKNDYGSNIMMAIEKPNRQTAQFFYQAQETSGRQTAPSNLQSHNIKSAPMISKRFLQLLDQKQGPQAVREVFLPQMVRTRPKKFPRPLKTDLTFESQFEDLIENRRKVSAHEIDQFTTDISFDGQPTNEPIFKKKLKSNITIKQNQKLLLKEQPNSIVSLRKQRDALVLSKLRVTRSQHVSAQSAKK